MRLLLPVLLAACGATPPTAPTALPEARHGHRIERLDDGYLCFGGFGKSSEKDRGTKACSMLRDGSREWQPCPLSSLAVVSAAVDFVTKPRSRCDSADRERPRGGGRRHCCHFARTASGKNIAL